MTPVGNLQVLDISRTILDAPNVTKDLLIKGAGSTGTTGADGAIDRITNEILLSLDERPTLVVWLFDQSGSLESPTRIDRQAVRPRVRRAGRDRGLGQPRLPPPRGQAAAHGGRPFGESVQLLTKKPTDDVAAIKEAVRGVADDPSGRENVFQSVQLRGGQVSSLPHASRRGGT